MSVVFGVVLFTRPGLGAATLALLFSRPRMHTIKAVIGTVVGSVAVSLARRSGVPVVIVP